MHKYRYRVYLKGRTIDQVVECSTPSEGERMLREQYGCQVTWMGRV